MRNLFLVLAAIAAMFAGLGMGIAQSPHGPNPAMTDPDQQAWRLFLTTGILGGFTTFSAFSLEAVLLYEQGDRVAAAAYVAGSVVFSIGALFAALALVRTLMRK